MSAEVIRLASVAKAKASRQARQAAEAAQAARRKLLELLAYAADAVNRGEYTGLLLVATSANGAPEMARTGMTTDCAAGLALRFANRLTGLAEEEDACALGID